MLVENIPQVPFEEFNLHLFASDRGLMATPTRCTRLPRRRDPRALERDPCRRSTRAPSSRSPRGPNGNPCPGQVRPFNPRLVAGTSNALAGDFSAFTLKLDRDDGDQFLGDLNFRMPPGFTGSLRGITYCPEALDRRRRTELRPRRAGEPELPAASSQVGTTNVAAGPGAHPFHAIGKMYLAGPFKGAPISRRRDHPGAGRPLSTTASWSSGSRSTSTR